MPALRSGGLRGAIAYHDGQFDDSRLALALARSAVDRGAVVCNYTRSDRLLYENDRVAGAMVRDVETGAQIEVRARTVLNATGIFVDDLRAQDAPGAPKLLEHSRGTHVVFSRDHFPGTDALIVPKTDDGRVLFAIPWHDHVVVGTTDVEMQAAELEPAPPRDEVDYIVEHFNRYLERPVRREDALASFAGIRPLVNRKNVGTAKLSREHIVETSPRGLVTITGGKWTTYRKMGEDAVDALARAGGLAGVASATADLRLRGTPDASAQRAVDGRYAIYGSDAQALLELEREDPSLAQPLDGRLAVTGAQVVYAVREEGARSVDDVLSRRTRAAFLDGVAALAMAPDVARLVARELGRDDTWIASQLTAFAAIVEPTLEPLGLGRDAPHVLA
jgi:glycerol-3-phosphate dehydrogenase